MNEKIKKVWEDHKVAIIIGGTAIIVTAAYLLNYKSKRDWYNRGWDLSAVTNLTYVENLPDMKLPTDVLSYRNELVEKMGEKAKHLEELASVFAKGVKEA